MPDRQELGDQNAIVIHVLADEDSRVLDEVLAEQLGEGRYRVLRSPPLALGIAAGDTIEVTDPPTGRFDVIERGGNVAVQLWHRAPVPDSLAAVDAELAPALAAIGGWLDERVDDRVAVFTVPLTSGFGAIEAVMNHFVERHPETEWLYGNVYDPVDGVTPLGWWSA